MRKLKGGDNAVEELLEKWLEKWLVIGWCQVFFDVIKCEMVDNNMTGNI